MHCCVRLTVAIALFFVNVYVANAVPLYQLVDLGVLPGYDSSVAYAINDHGDLVGDSYLASTGGETGHAFKYSRDHMMDLGTLGGVSSVAWAINKSGIVVGRAGASNGTARAFRYDTSMHDLGYTGAAHGINDSGTIVGATVGGMFVVDSSEPINTLSLNARWGWDVNNHGAIVGTTQSNIQAYYFDKYGQVLLGRLSSGQISNAFGINDLGDVVGESLTSSSSDSGHAFLWMSGLGMIDLGIVGVDAQSSVAWDLNNRREVVGSVRLAPGRFDYVHGFYWVDGMMYDLNDLLVDSLGYTIATANGINNYGQIAGSAFAPNGTRHAVLLNQINKVPEPSNLVLIGLGLVTVTVVRFRQVIRIGYRCHPRLAAR